jgi:hypothetical protein
MKEQSGWAWNAVTRLPNVDAEVMNDYIEVSGKLFSNMFRHLIFLQAHPKSKQYFTKPFPMFDDISDLLGDTRATGFALSDGRQNAKASQAIPGSSQAPSLTPTSTLASFAIDPELEAISLEMQSTQGIDGEEAVRYLTISIAISLIFIAISLIMLVPRTKGSNVLSKG